MHFGFIEGLEPGMRYGLRAEGPWDSGNGHRFDHSKLLVDPYATALDRPFTYDARLGQRGVDTAFLAPKALIETDIAPPTDHLPEIAPVPRFIYEVQVKSFSMRHPAIAPDLRGTISALAEPAVIEHLQKLGVDTIELMPIAAWIDERHLPPLGLSNGWGYNPVAFMAPDPRLAPGGFAEIRRVTDILRANGLKVILDIVFNHSGESDAVGPTLSLRGLDNALYYAHAEGQLVNHSGCGNTLALDRAPVVQFAMDAMRCWVARGGFDGFRFDLAPVMGRLPQGFDPNAPLLAAIEQDPVLSRCIMIAEPWDVGPGGYRLGGFPARWCEWNDHYRDNVRRFWNGQEGPGLLATRLAGSSDIFAPHRRPSCSINYLAAHDGFTLRDAVTYAAKQNHANGEDNRDGNGHEPTWPGGDVRALLATLFLSRGTPMLTAGDELGRSQNGNNNAYAQDNATTWLDWTAADDALISFVADLVKLRQSLPAITEDRFLTGAIDPATGFADVQWLGADGHTIDWHDGTAPVLGLLLAQGPQRIALWFNRGRAAAEPVLPRRDGWRWQRVFCSATGAELPARSVAVFIEDRVVGAGASDGQLRDLAQAAGIESTWWEVDGTRHEVTPETLRAVLTALRLPHTSATDVEASQRHLKQRRRPQVVRAGEAFMAFGPAPSHRRFHVVDDRGVEQVFEAGAGEALSISLGAGIHRGWSADAADEVATFIASPGSCHLPADIAAGARVFGLASHLYALRHTGDGGIGDFETLRRFADVTRQCGGRYAGLNPLHHMFPSDRSRASPYQPSDRRFIDPIYICIDALLGDIGGPKARALAAKSRAAFAALEGLAFVDYPAVWAAKQAILEQAFAEFDGSPAFDRFVIAGGDDLVRHGRFEATRGGEVATPQRIAYRAFLQWVAEDQLAKAATNRSLYRDLALGSAFDGGEISEAPDDFAQGVSLGAPPDPFSRAGQVWNLPPHSPLALQERHFAPLQTVLAANMRHAAALRIDHILGFMRQFWVPRGAEGRFGAYVNFPVDAMIAVAAIESQRHHCMIVGEDLGTIPDGLRDRLMAAQILSYRVLWFEREGQGFKPPEHYPELALACLASHDLPTFMGWRAGRDIAIEAELGLIDGEEAARRKEARKAEVSALAQLTGAAGAGDVASAAAVHGYVACTPSRVMLVQADDLGGETEPLNVPGTDTERPNWRRRIATDVETLATAPLATAILDRVKAERR